MIYLVLGAVLFLALGGAGWALYRYGRSRERESVSAKAVETLEAKDARRKSSIDAADRFVDLVFPKDSPGDGDSDTP